MQIRRLSPLDAKLFQALRLAALQETPSAFGASYEEEIGLPSSAIEARLIERHDQGVWGAFNGGALIGTLGLAREQRHKLSHKAILWGMYVAPAMRGKGVARALLRQVLAFSRSEPAIIQINLCVNASNPGAIALYESEGFTTFGREPFALMIDGKMHDELHMFLRPSVDFSESG